MKNGLENISAPSVGQHGREVSFLYISHRAAWVSSNGPMLALHTFAWHMKAMVGLFHVAKEDSGTRMIKRQETKFWSSSGEPSSGGKLKDQILVPKTKFWLVNKWMRMDVSDVKHGLTPNSGFIGTRTTIAHLNEIFNKIHEYFN